VAVVSLAATPGAAVPPGARVAAAHCAFPSLRPPRRATRTRAAPAAANGVFHLRGGAVEYCAAAAAPTLAEPTARLRVAALSGDGGVLATGSAPLAAVIACGGRVCVDLLDTDGRGWGEAVVVVVCLASG
jgi:hypothetical protein